MREPLSRDYWQFWGAATLSNLGDGLRLVAIPLLAVTLTRDPLLVAGVTALAFVPWVVVGPVSGAIVDRVDRRRLIVTVQILRGVVVGLFTVGLALDVVNLPVLYAVALIVGLGETLADSAAQAAIPRLATQTQLERANSRLIAGEIVTNEVVGGPIGGLLFALATALPFGIDAGTYLVAAAMVARVRTDLGPSRAKAATTTLRADVLEGLRWLWRDPILRPLALAVALVNLGVSAIGALLVLFAVEVLDLPAVGFGILVGVGAAGGLAGTVVAGPLVARFGRTASMVVPTGIAGLGLLALALSPNALVAGASLLIGFGAVSVFNVVGRSVRQAVTPSRILGRVVAGFRFVGLSTVPVSAVISGIVADLLGLRAPFLLGAVLVAVATVVMGRVLGDDAITTAIGANPDLH